ncbi:hypothetical protein [Azospirillum sp. ST 5-10]|uniref:hypothetical protein n=1 Tax=unclassified Azospirillum TaxID=2630922 RepID=UPI003F49DAE6
MAQISPLLTTALPVASSMWSTGQRARQSQAELDYQRQQEAARQQQEAARLAYEQQALERRYDEERRAREEDARRRAEEQARDQAHQLELLQQERELDRQDRERQAAEEEAARRREMQWLSQSQTQAYEQLRARQTGDQASAVTDARNRLTTLTEQAQADERRRRDALRRAMGRSRAALGAGGVSAADGSGEAILLGLVADSDAERGEARRLDTLKRQAIQQEVDNTRRRNLLEQAQLAERQRLDFLSRYF